MFKAGALHAGCTNCTLFSGSNERMFGSIFNDACSASYSHTISVFQSQNIQSTYHSTCPVKHHCRSKWESIARQCDVHEAFVLIILVLLYQHRTPSSKACIQMVRS